MMLFFFLWLENIFLSFWIKLWRWLFLCKVLRVLFLVRLLMFIGVNEWVFRWMFLVLLVLGVVGNCIVWILLDEIWKLEIFVRFWRCLWIFRLMFMLKLFDIFLRGLLFVMNFFMWFFLFVFSCFKYFL